MKRLCAVLLVSSLVLLSGCEDLTAQSKANESATQVVALKKQLDEVSTRNEALSKSVESLRNDMNTKVDARLDKLSNEMEARQKQFLEEIKSITQKAVTDSTGIADRLRSDYDASFASAKASMATDVKALRAEVKTEVEEQKKFMDNQLRELYPYAYQPRRLDGNTPPPADAK
jgi:TolA-binding protein